jgi:hypothetical protein
MIKYWLPVTGYRFVLKLSRKKEKDEENGIVQFIENIKTNR